jgi:hypothetical protein
MLAGSPFSSFLIPGILLFVFLGLYPLAVAFSLWKRPDWRWPAVVNPWKHVHWSWAASLAVGVIGVIWIIVQVQWISFSFLQVLILGLAVLIILLTLMPEVYRYYIH